MSAAVGGGWFSPASIEARTRVKRRPRPSGATAARTRPLLSEEDAYLEAGAPGYEALPAAVAAAPAAAAAAAIAPTAAAAAAATSIVAAAAPPPSPGYGVFSRDAADWPVVRHSTGRVALRSLPSLVRAFQLSALPAYAAAPGCLGATLWVGGVPAEASPAEICAAALAARPGADGGGDATVQATTTWRSGADLDAATASDAYRAAMAVLAPFFKDRPVSVVLRQVAAAASSGASG